MNDPASELILWVLPPCWGLPNASPYCLKVETWLRMAEIPYVAKAIPGAPKSKTGKAPYVERGDGTMVEDSHVILKTLTAECSVGLDGDLTSDQRVKGLLVQRLCEESLYFHVLCDRWLDDGNWPQTRDGYFAAIPKPARALVTSFIRRGVRKAAHGQGVTRLPPGVRLEKGLADIEALAASVVEGPFLLGEPSSYDATVFAFVANLLWAPTRSELAEAAKTKTDLVDYAERMRSRYWPDWPGSLAKSLTK